MRPYSSRPARTPLNMTPRLANRITVLDAVAGAAAYTLAMLLRFADEGAVPPTYAARAVPWAAFAAAIHVAGGMAADRLRRPRSPVARQPIAPFAVAGALALGAVLAINYLVLPLELRLPLSVAIVGPLLASGAGAVVRLAFPRTEVLADELLPRRVVQLDVEACAPALRGKRILITGAAGSIGSELARQALAVGPASLLLLDTNETGLYELEGELAALRPGVPVRPLIGDVSDAHGMEQLFRREGPQVVFHAAAYKHVPLVEANPEQGFISNVLGTLTICEAAVAAGAERVVVISTDKAVNPASFMGLTKRLAELIVAAVGQQTEQTTISAVRFGNVLGSRGSVVPTLIRQIETGKPVTITHPEVQRFFMTTSEAASLVLRSAAFGEPGAIFVLDMGEELRIRDLAERLVRLKGLRPGRDVPFVYTGLRPGEKLREELVAERESLRPTDHPYVRRVEAAYTIEAERVLAGVRRLDKQRRAGGLRPEDYPAALRALVEGALRPTQLAAVRLEAARPSATSG
jgi:nucleoside-diphosphate-sugar epimerase